VRLSRVPSTPDDGTDVRVGSAEGRRFVERGDKIRVISARRATASSVATMKKRSRAVPDSADDLRPEYRFDYSKARPNPYADRLKGQAVAVLLDPEVAAAFPTSESVNTALRSIMGLVSRRSARRPSRRAG
jgi:hypothetical protein